MTRYVLTCCKTGRWFRYATEAQCYRAARHLGLTDYLIEKGA